MPEIDVGKLDKALIYAEDMMRRSQIEFMLFGDTAYSVYYNTFPKYNKINLGIKAQDFTEFGRRILSMTVKDAVIDEHKIKFNSEEGIPIEIRIIHKNYPFFEHPEHILFHMDDYCIPNPFEKYWKVYRLIM